VRFVCGFSYLVGLDLPMRNYTTFMSGLCFFFPYLLLFQVFRVCVCVGERENSLSQVKATSLLAILVIVSPNAFRVLTCLVAGIVSVSVSRELIEIRT